MITKRVQELSEGQVKDDFLSMLIQDETFNGDISYAIDESITFLIAGTVTTSMMLTNAVYYLSQPNRALETLRADIKSKVNLRSFRGISSEEWSRILLGASSSEDDGVIYGCPYIGYCVYETLRIAPSVRLSSIHEAADDFTLVGKRVFKGQHI